MKDFATDETPRCILGQHDVGCDEPTNCERCGWNDEVAKQRIINMYGEKYVDYITKG